MSSVKKMAGAGSSCAGFLSSVGCKIRCPLHKSFYECMPGVRHWRHGAFCVSRQQRLCRRWPRRISCIIHERLIVFIHRLRNSVSRTISNANDTQAQQVAPNPRGGRFSTEILWSENADLKFNASNEEEDGSNKQRNRKNINQWISNVKVILRANWSDFGWLAGN